ncbi:sugar kinase [Longispora fulva]|uniref:Putative NBD/HSP70 family sugar kinase n=1 Tax=Longispora fulva TaxID=619741 RepID=A0A8J7G902_9ACTN|nr:ROK family protein [Longispora fulva]MBG6135020.1 putative NBD/HSP70 family sugar kinase [Longispora fulva]GIG56745.1 sugar kinase [Longispora fulva]
MARSPIAPAPASAGDVLRLVLTGTADTRGDIGRLTGLSRTAVTARVSELLTRGLLVETTVGPSTGGRPPVRLSFNAAAGVVLAAAVGVTRTQFGVYDLAGDPLAEDSGPLDATRGPEAVFAWLLDRWRGLLAELGRTADDVRGVGLAVPAPVDVATGRTGTPPTFAGWDDVDLAAPFAAEFGVPVVVDNDVNAMAVGEHWARRAEGITDLLAVKVSAGIGAGVVAGGVLQRGAIGAAGELGHIRVENGGGVLCRCGNSDCLEAVAGGSALVRRLADDGLPVSSVADLVSMVGDGNPRVVHTVRDAGRRLGEVLAAAVNILNPAVVVLGGDLARAYEPLVAGVRETVYQRAAAYATRRLRIVPSVLDERAGLVGCTVLVLNRVLSASAVDAAVAARTPR